MEKEFKVVTRESYKDGIRSIEPIELTCILSSPNGEEPKTITEEDVWGRFDETRTKKIDRGMIVARSGEICPIFGDEVPYKSVTVVGPKNKQDEIIYWLEYVHGGGSVSEIVELDDLRVAIRSDYQCW